MLRYRALFLLELLTLILIPTLHAQHRHLQDVLYLDNGWIIRGTITSPDSVDQVTILTEGHNQFVFDRSAIREIIQEDARHLPGFTGEADRGLIGLVEMGAPAGTNSNAWGSTTEFGFQLRAGAGYRLDPRIALLGVAGLSSYQALSGFLLPLTAELRSDWSAGRVSPFTYLEGGYALPLYRPWGFDEIGNEVQGQAWGGPVAGGGLGIKIRTRSSLGWTLSAGYLYQTSREAYQSWGNVQIEERHTFQRFSFRWGIMF
ncbi:MAG: hypothetical protein D6722_15430 [Bacteroidetes bacterium]|nr:MAG: hypothetical protein D6722_15430 [Bacteroidota bacterium]